MVSCIGLIDHESKSYFLIDATADIKDQMHRVEYNTGYSLQGILLTHAHIGHYTGLMDLGREAMGASAIKVWTMPRMKHFLENNGPWSQLVALKNISLQGLQNDSMVQLSQNLNITPHLVPHRDEYSETVGFLISGESKTGWFIPDIDKWSQWDRSLSEELKNDFLFIDGTFYANGEIPGRDMSEIPHPFIEETMALLKNEPDSLKSKLHFIHFNHTNPVLWDDEVRKIISSENFVICTTGMSLDL
jgi:pyrroloquinoline quinone biosynthesis protein B